MEIDELPVNDDFVQGAGANTGLACLTTLKALCFRALYLLGQEGPATKCATSKATLSLIRAWHSVQVIVLLMLLTHENSLDAAAAVTGFLQSEEAFVAFLQVFLVIFWILLGLAMGLVRQGGLPSWLRAALVAYNLVCTHCYMPILVCLGKTVADMELATLVGSVAGLLVLPLTNYSYILASAELRHTSRNLSARAHSNLETRTLQLQLVEALVFVSVPHASAATLCIILCEGWLACSFIYWMPFYSRVANTLRVFEHAAAALCGVWFLLGAVLQNRLMMVALTVSVTPCLLYILSEYVIPYRLRSVPRLTSANVREFTDARLLELGLRPLFKKRTSDVLTLLGQCRTTQLCVVWEVNYCTDVLGDYRLARIKLTKQAVAQTDFEAAYQFYLANMRVEKYTGQHFEEVDFVKYQLNLRSLKQQDCRLCLAYARLLREFLSEEFCVTKLLGTLQQFSEHLNGVEQQYADMLSEHPDSGELLELYSSYVSQVLQDHEEAASHIRRVHSSRLLQQARFSLFNSNNAVLIVTAAPEALGRVIFANPNAATLLGTSLMSLMDSSLCDFLPPPFSENHDKNLARFIQGCTQTKIRVPRHNFVLNAQGFLEEVEFKAKCTGINGEPFYLVLIRAYHKQREIILVDSELRIAATTASVPDGLNEPSYIGRNLRDLFVLPESLVDRTVFKAGKLTFSYRETTNGIVTLRYFKVSVTQSLIPSLFRSLLQTQFLRETTRRRRGSRPSLKLSGIRLSSQAGNMTSTANTQGDLVGQVRSLHRPRLSMFKICATLLCVVILGTNATASGLLLAQSEHYFDTVHEANQSVQHILTILEVIREEQLVGRTENSLARLEACTTAISQFHDFFEAMSVEFPNEFPKTDSCVYWEYADGLLMKEEPIVNGLDKFVRVALAYAANPTEDTDFLVVNGNGPFYEYFIQFQERVLQASLAGFKNKGFSITIAVGLGLTACLILVMACVSVRLHFAQARALQRLTATTRRKALTLQTPLIARLQDLHKLDLMITTPPNNSEVRVPREVCRVLWRSLLMFAVFILSCCLSEMMYHMLVGAMVVQRLPLISTLHQVNQGLGQLQFWTGEAVLMEHSVETAVDGLYPLPPPTTRLQLINEELADNLEAVLGAGLALLTEQEATSLLKSSDCFGDYGIYEAVREEILHANSFQECVDDCAEAYAAFCAKTQSTSACLQEFIQEFTVTSDELAASLLRTLLYTLGGMAAVCIALVVLLSVNFLRREEKVFTWISDYYELVKRKPANNSGFV